MEIDEIVMNVYSALLEHNTSWIIDGVLRHPLYEDVELVVKRLIEAVQKSAESISIETAGVLVKKDGKTINVYTRMGSL